MTALPRNLVSLAVSGLFLCLLSFGVPAVFSQKPTSPTEPSPSLQPQSKPECTHQEHPIISIQALSPWISIFSHPGVRDYSQLTLDLTRNELIVGARNYLFRLNLSNISLIQTFTVGKSRIKHNLVAR